MEPLLASDGHLYVLRGGARAEFVVRDAGPLERAVFRVLDERPCTPAELHDELRAAGVEVTAEDVAGMLAQLEELGLLQEDGDRGADVLGTGVAARFDRQLAYFAEQLPHPSQRWDAQRRLADARVAVLGCGGLGSWALAGLACTGIGELVLADGDAVELTNLNRQVTYRRADVGRAKVAATAGFVRALDPEVRVTTVERRLEGIEEVAEVVRGADLVIETADWPPYEFHRWVNAACAAEGIAHLAAGQFPPLVRVGPLVMPGETGCASCQDTAARREFPLYDEVVEFRRRRPVSAAAIGPVCGVIGTLLASEAFHFLSGLRPVATEGAAIVVDLRTLATTREPVTPDPACPDCTLR